MDCSKNFPAVDLSSPLSTSSASSNNRNSLCSSPVVELQSGNLSEREIRNAGIHPTTSQMSTDTGSFSSSTTVSLGKLKEPRDLYSTATLLHPIKWPVECQVIPEKIRHISATPPKMESFYNPTGKETQPQPVGIEMGTVVYDYQPKLSVDYFCRATVGGSQDLEQFVTNNIEPTTLRFESRFESGNLAKAIKVTNAYYELYLRPDLYTDRHAQWFYFRIQNTKENVQYRFSIVNFNKPDSLYRYGLKILMYSEKEAQLNNVGWTRCGQNIAYFKNDISLDDNGPYYTLTFNLKFRHNNDTVYLAQCYPYTYSTLQNYLKSIEDDEFKSQLLTIRLLCRSLAGNNVHVLTVTSPTDSSSAPDDKAQITPSVTTAQNEENAENNKKPVIVISARVHPGESQSSYMMKGIIDFLTSDCSQAKELRDRFIFKLIPMLNPDGVIVGNTRCCLLGQDLNRQYRTVLREAFPQIYHAKVMLRRLQEENGIFLYCDLHGHSRKHNVFIYGCENRKMPEKRLVEQVFPLMMHKNAADKFSFQSCKFKIQKNKEGTGRIFAWTLGIVNSYTLEISLGGSTMLSRQYTHFTTADYEACGRHFCETLLDYSDPNPAKETLRERILQKLVDGGSTADEPKNVVLSDYSSLSHSETDGEDGEDGDEDSGDDGNNSFSTKSSSGFGSSTTPNSSVKQQLKRQMSLRKHHQSHQSSNSGHNNRVKSAGKQSVKNETRSPLFIHKATVDFTKIKYRKLDEPVAAPPISSVGAPNNPALEEKDLTTSTGDSIKEILPPTGRDSRELSDAFRRLTKFRRKSRRNNNVHGDHLDHHQYQLTAKCTSILFDDPFNPPGTRLNRTDREYYHHHHKRTARCRENLEAIEVNSAWQSGTEDECDPYDMTIKTPAPSIKVIDCGGAGGCESGVSNEDFAQALTVDMSKLAVSNNQRSSSDSETGSQLPLFAPFTPSFPVGKTFLHQTCYPDKGNSPKRNKNPKEGESKLKNSLSDTTIAITSSALSPSISPSATQPRPIVARRSSLTYLSTGKINKLQTTANSAAGASQTVASSRRRVSWTGTLTVSVPNVPMSALCNAPGGVLRSPLMNSQHKKKSFRKCKSLNDKPSQQQPQNSSSELNDSSASLGTSASMDKISSGSSSSGQVIGNSYSVGNIASNNTVLPSTSSLGAKKRRAKLKRSKHK